ncbi:MAG: hypothetical protein HKM89_14670 [Gemmatimonadales bacterium]|nr:hypothetical protein [Gemmatimonadales bacterium]
MRPDPTDGTLDFESQAQAGARVASRLADAIPNGPEATMAVSRSLTDTEIVCGLSFLGTVLEIASVSSKTLAEAQKERRGLLSRPPQKPARQRTKWN